MKAPAPAIGQPGMAGMLPLLNRLRHGAGWRTLQRRFDHCAPRERLLLIAAAAGLAFMLADALWLGPALAQYRSAHRERVNARVALETLQSETRTLSERAVATTRQQQAELVQWRERVRDGEAKLRQHEDHLVGPDQMVDLLQQMLTNRGPVRVRALQSLGRTDLLAPPPGSPASAAAGSAPAAALPSLYRHGVELVLEGGFGDLLQTLKALEGLPQHMLWGALSLKVEQHPKSVLTLRVYTISRDRHWLEI